jgi:hypothetical protein
MSARILLIATVATFGIAVSAPANATVVGPQSTFQKSAGPLDLVHKARRICQQVFRCGTVGQGCWWEQKCHVTADYPPENGERRDRR